MVYDLNGTTLSTGGGSGMLSTSEMPMNSSVNRYGETRAPRRMPFASFFRDTRSRSIMSHPFCAGTECISPAMR